MYLSAAILEGGGGGEGDPGDIQGYGAGFVDFCCQFLARDWGLNCFCSFVAEFTGEDPRDL